MKDFKIGKKLYRSTALLQFKLVFIAIALWVLVNLYFKTYSDPDFLAKGAGSFRDVIDFHMVYPVQVIGYILGTLIPALYYAFFRGIVFFEKGLVVNKGLPFLNNSIRYDDVESFRIVHPKYLMSLKRKDTSDEVLFTLRDMDRVIAIFDQQGITAHLGEAREVHTFTLSKKIVVFSLLFGVLVSVLQYTGVIIDINRYFFR
jgi:hypothetical protein